ncbi:MAG: hypothetical protein ACTS6G_01840 [Candidatus Hodgkinia cicadicola]
MKSSAHSWAHIMTCSLLRSANLLAAKLINNLNHKTYFSLS